MTENESPGGQNVATPSIASENSDRSPTIIPVSSPSVQSQSCSSPSDAGSSPSEAELKYKAAWIPLAQRNTLCLPSRTVAQAKFFIEILNTANYMWIFYTTLFDHTGDTWAFWVQITIFILYMIFNSQYFYYDSWPHEKDGEPVPPSERKHFFPTMQGVESKYKRLLLKILYVTGFGKLFQHYFVSTSTTDEDFHNEVEGVVFLTISELFVFYIPTVLLKSIQNEMSDNSLSSLQNLFCFLCTVKHVVTMISKQNYAHYKDYLSMLIVTAQVGPDIFFRTYTFAIMAVNISGWTMLIYPFIYCTLNFFDNDWFAPGDYISRIFYGIFLTPLHVVSNLQWLYSSTLDWKMILFEQFLRVAIGSSVFIFEIDDYGSTSSILIISSLIMATFFEMYILAYHDFFKTRDEIT